MTVKQIRELKERYVVDEKGKRVGVLLDPKVYKELLAQLESLRAEDTKLRRKRAKNARPRAATRTRKPAGTRVTQGVITERERAVEVLRSAGMLTELDPELKRQAAEWRALPEERKREVIEKLNSLRLDPPLSQIIHDERR